MDAQPGRTYIIGGGGAIGGSIAALATHAGVPVVAVVNPVRAERLRAAGGLVVSVIRPDGSYDDALYPLELVETPELAARLTPADRLLLCTKSEQAEAALAPVRESGVPVAVVNTLNGRLDLARFVPPGARLYRALIEYGATRQGDDRVLVTTNGRRAKIGPWAGDCTPQELETLRQVLAPVAATQAYPTAAEMHRVEAAKFLFNCAFNATSCVLGYTFRQIMEDRWARRLFVDLYCEAHDALTAAGEQIGPLGMIPGNDTTWRLLRNPLTRNLLLAFIKRLIGDMYSSMAQDLDAGRKTEVPYLTSQVPGPRSQAVTRRIHELEEAMAGGKARPRVGAEEFYT